MTKKERKIVHLFKELQRDDWIKKYVRLSRKLWDKYDGNHYSDEHLNDWDRKYKGLLKRYNKKWLDIFNKPWGSI